MSFSPPLSVVLRTSPTFDTVWEDMQRANETSTPIVTARETASKTTLFQPTEGVHVDQDVEMRIPSPLSDTDLLQIINLEGASWAIEFDGAAHNSPPASLTPISNPHINPPHVQDESFPPCPELPAVYHKLCDAGSPFWAAVSIDLQNYLWIKMSRKLNGREPTKTLFHEVYNDAICRRMSFSAIWHPVKVSLEVPIIALNGEASSDRMVAAALQMKGPLCTVESEMTTTPTDAKFVLAFMLMFTSSWARYRSYCYEKAALAVLPQTVHGSCGLLPEPQDFTKEFRLKLRNLIDDRSKGWGLLHEHPSSSAQVQPFVWFGNPVLKEVVHRALYDPKYPGWFGILEDVKTRDGHRSWAPLQVASPRQVGQVLGWLEELLNFNIIQANKIQGPVLEYVRPPDSFTAYDSVIKKADRHAKYLSVLAGGSGEVLGLDDPSIQVVAGPDELQARLQGYQDFVRRPSHLPFNVGTEY